MSFNFGSSFSAPSTTTFNFGGGTQSKGFGQTGFGFGSNTSTTAAAPTFSFGPATTSAPSIGFGAIAKPAANTGFGNIFGSSATTNAGTFGFGTPAATTTQSLFSGFGQTQTTSSGFGGFGGGFGTSTALGTGPTFNFGQPQQLQQQQQQQLQQQQHVPDAEEQFWNSIFKCDLYGDGRDQIITKWNLLQALWGCGKGYYAQNSPAFEYTQQNLLCRLKTYAYSVKPKASASDALIAISINKKAEEIKNQQVQFECSIANILGNKPTITVHVDCIRPSSESKSIVLIYIEERTSAVLTRRIPQNEVCSYLLQPSPKQQLMSMGVDNVYEFVYRKEPEEPPAGIDPKMWKHAHDNNPNHSKFVPVPIIGLENMEWRLKCQENETKAQQTMVDNLSGDINSLQRLQNINNARINECEQGLIRLQHRVSKMFVRLSKYPNTTFGPEEETLKARLEHLSSTLTKPQSFKNRFAEMISSVRLHNTDESKLETAIDDDTLKNIKELLSIQISAIGSLKAMVDEDVADVKKIKEDLKKLPSVD